MKPFTTQIPPRASASPLIHHEQNLSTKPSPIPGIDLHLSGNTCIGITLDGNFLRVEKDRLILDPDTPS